MTRGNKPEKKKRFYHILRRQFEQCVDDAVLITKTRLIDAVLIGKREFRQDLGIAFEGRVDFDVAF